MKAGAGKWQSGDLHAPAMQKDGSAVVRASPLAGGPGSGGTVEGSDGAPVDQSPAAAAQCRCLASCLAAMSLFEHFELAMRGPSSSSMRHTARCTRHARWPSVSCVSTEAKPITSCSDITRAHLQKSAVGWIEETCEHCVGLAPPWHLLQGATGLHVALRRPSATPRGDRKSETNLPVQAIRTEADGWLMVCARTAAATGRQFECLPMPLLEVCLLVETTRVRPVLAF